MGHGTKIPTIKASENPMRSITKIVKERKKKRIRITELELLFCSKDNEIIQFDKKCVECKHFKGHYSATGYIECNH